MVKLDEVECNEIDNDNEDYHDNNDDDDHNDNK